MNREQWKAEARTLRGEKNVFENDLAHVLEVLESVRLWCSDPCSDECCESCDGKNEAYEQVLHLINTGLSSRVESG